MTAFKNSVKTEEEESLIDKLFGIEIETSVKNTENIDEPVAVTKE